MASSPKFKRVIDVVMVVLFLLLMAKQLTGATVHEYLGVVMFIFWGIHFHLNRKWCKSLFKGRYTFSRILQLTINILLLLTVCGIVLSSILISGKVFAFLAFDRNIEVAQRAHIFFAFWYLILMSLHLGLHWNMVVKAVSRIFKSVAIPDIVWCVRGILILFIIYGVYSFFKNDIPSYLFLSSSYVFFDFERPMILYVTEYISIIAVLISVMHYGVRLLHRKTQAV